jgi:hypothetical protein
VTSLAFLHNAAVSGAGAVFSVFFLNPPGRYKPPKNSMCDGEEVEVTELSEALARVLDEDGTFGIVAPKDIDGLRTVMAKWARVEGAGATPTTLWAALDDHSPGTHRHLLNLISAVLAESSFSHVRMAVARLYLTWLCVPNAAGAGNGGPHRHPQTRCTPPQPPPPPTPEAPSSPRQHPPHTLCPCTPT